MKKKILAVVLAAVVAFSGITPASDVHANEIPLAEQPGDGDVSDDGFETAKEWNGESYESTLKENEEAFFKYVPQKEGIYVFSFAGSSDVHGQLYTADGNLIAEDMPAEEGSSHNYSVTYYLTADTAYYLKAYGYSVQENSFVISAAQRQAKGLEIFYDPDVFVTYGQEAALEFIAASSAGEVSCKWYKGALDEANAIAGAAGKRYVLPADNEEENYYCKVTSGEHAQIVSFRVYIDTGLKAESSAGVDAGEEEGSSADRIVELEYGEEAELEVEVSGGAKGKELQYQWYAGNTDGEYSKIEGATAGSYTVSGVAGCAEEYYCEVTDGIDSDGVSFSIRIDSGLEVGSETGEDAEGEEESSSSRNVTVVYGKKETLQVTASGGADNGKLSYQWYKLDETEEYRAIEGATGSKYVLSADADSEASYYCEVSDGVTHKGVYFYISLDTGLEVESGILNEDGDTMEAVTVDYGKKLTLKVAASGGAGPLKYQWYKSYAPDEECLIEGATASSYQVAGNEECGSDYYCSVTDGVISKGIGFSVTLDTGLVVGSEDGDDRFGEQGSTEARNITIEYEEEMTLNVDADGGIGELSYQWYKSDDAYEDDKIEGADTSSIEISGDAECGECYYCEVSDSLIRKGVVFYITVDTGMEVSSSTGDDADGNDGSSSYREINAEYGDEITLEVDADGGIGELSYQWYKSSMAEEEYIIDEATDSFYDVYADEDGEGEYYCEVTDGISRKGVVFNVILPNDEEIDIEDCDISVNAKKAFYTGSPVEPEVTVEYEGAILEEGTDYNIDYRNNIKIGKAKVIITGEGDYFGEAERAFSITAKKGKNYVAKGYIYKVTGKSQVAFMGTKKTKVKIPKAVKIGGKSFKVTSIASKALRKSKATSITVGDNVKNIDKAAFENCSKLLKVTLGKGVTVIGPNAFKNCKKLGKVTVKSTKIKKIGKNALKGIKPNAKVKVPAKKLKAYRRLFKGKGQGKKVAIVK